MIKKLKFISILAIAAIMTVSCSKDDPQPETVTVTTGAYILNNGNYGSNDSSLMLYNTETKVMTPNIFRTTNGIKLGDCGQDMLIYGSKMYIGVYTSAVIYVTDINCKILKTITHNEIRSPRSVKADGGYVYISYYEGYVGRIDTLSYNETEVAVGPNPEQMQISNNKLYVANSGGMNYPAYNNTVSVINLNSFTVTKTIEVVTNPQFMEKDDAGNIYLISTGNYSTIPSSLQLIDPSTDKVTAVTAVSNPSWMAVGKDNKMYLICSKYDANWNLTADYNVFNTSTGTLEGSFISDGTTLDKNPY